MVEFSGVVESLLTRCLKKVPEVSEGGGQFTLTRGQQEGGLVVWGNCWSFGISLGVQQKQDFDALSGEGPSFSAFDAG